MEELFNEGLLVAFMFILVLSMGIGSILTGFSELTDRRIKPGTHWLPFSWLLLLLLIHFGLFWDSLDILLVEDWRFPGFVYVNIGPILLLLATNMLVPRAGSADTASPREHYFKVAPWFFLILACCMLWGVGADFILQQGFQLSSLWNVAGIPIMAVLAVSRKAAVHAGGTLLYGLAFLSFYLPYGFGMMS